MRVADLDVRPDLVTPEANVLLAATERPGQNTATRARSSTNGPPVPRRSARADRSRAYLAVATRPAQNNGLGLKPADAAANVQAIRERTAFLAEDAKVADRLQALLADVECSGKQVHDANVIATMLAHGVGTVVTMNVTDFARFERYVSLVEL